MKLENEDSSEHISKSEDNSKKGLIYLLMVLKGRQDLNSIP